MNISEDNESEEIIANLTPLIDVVFLLLIFFMVTTTFLNPEREIDIDLPTADSAGAVESPPEEIVINVRADGRIFVGGNAIEREPLIELLRNAAQHDPETPVKIRGDRLARHESIVSVMDACGKAGLFNLAVGTTTEEEG